MYETISWEVKEQVGLITLDRPDKLNSFTSQMLKELSKVVKEAAKREDVRALLITGAGKAFSAGQDLAEVQDNPNFHHGEFIRQYYNPLIMAIHQLEKPVIAAVNGVAAGAGLSLALACDFRLASKQASFLEAFVHIGLVPDSGNSYFLPRLIGLAKALELAILGEKIVAEQAYELGLVHRLYEPEELSEQAFLFAQKLAKMPTKAIGLIKKSMFKGTESSLEECLTYEAYAQEILGKSEDHQEGVNAFLERRKPQFVGK